MADIAGALAAIEERFDAAWTATPKGFENGAAPVVIDAEGITLPWVYFEAYAIDADIRGVGRPGSNVVIDDGETLTPEQQAALKKAAADLEMVLVPQPKRGPRRFKSLRSTYKRGVDGSTSTSCVSPLTRSETTAIRSLRRV